MVKLLCMDIQNPEPWVWWLWVGSALQQASNSDSHSHSPAHLWVNSYTTLPSLGSMSTFKSSLWNAVNDSQIPCPLDTVTWDQPHTKTCPTTSLLSYPHPAPHFHLKGTWGIAHKSYDTTYESSIQDALPLDFVFIQTCLHPVDCQG